MAFYVSHSIKSDMNSEAVDRPVCLLVESIKSLFLKSLDCFKCIRLFFVFFFHDECEYYRNCVTWPPCLFLQIFFFPGKMAWSKLKA